MMLPPAMKFFILTLFFSTDFDVNNSSTFENLYTSLLLGNKARVNDKYQNNEKFVTFIPPAAVAQRRTHR